MSDAIKTDAAATEGCAAVPGSEVYYCPDHKYNPPENSGMAFCPQCEFPEEMAETKCWCGEENPEYADEKDGLESRCGGTRHLNCYCGGDLCCCHHHGQAECFGCPDCEEDDDEYYDDEP